MIFVTLEEEEKEEEGQDSLQTM